jgi:hypothetical protein
VHMPFCVDAPPPQRSGAALRCIQNVAKEGPSLVTIRTLSRGFSRRASRRRDHACRRTIMTAEECRLRLPARPAHRAALWDTRARKSGGTAYAFGWPVPSLFDRSAVAVVCLQGANSIMLDTYEIWSQAGLFLFLCQLTPVPWSSISHSSLLC